MSDVVEVLQSAESALALGEKEQAKRILERYEYIKHKFQSHGVFDKDSWKKFDLKYEELMKKVNS